MSVRAGLSDPPRLALAARVLRNHFLLAALATTALGVAIENDLGGPHGRPGALAFPFVLSLLWAQTNMGGWMLADARRAWLMDSRPLWMPLAVGLHVAGAALVLTGLMGLAAFVQVVIEHG